MRTVHVGFTGTRRGVTDVQEGAIRQLVRALWTLNGRVVAHHGDCLGADATFYRIVRELESKTRVICHPPTGNSWRANLGGDEVRDCLHPLVRNAVIVRESQYVIAAPLEMVEKVRGGTWSTIRKARHYERPLAIVWRDGYITKERWQ